LPGDARLNDNYLFRFRFGLSLPFVPKNSFCTVWVWALEVPPVTIPEVGDCSQIYSTARSCGTNHGVVRHHFVVAHFLVGCGVWGACLGSSDWGDKDEPSCPNGHSIVGFNFFA
jgi:hypothetical protein